MASPPLQGVRLALNTQTPLIRFRDGVVPRDSDVPIPLDELHASEDVRLTTGGVTRMVLPLLKGWLADGTLAAAEWVALATGEKAPLVDDEGVRLSFVGMTAEEKEGYAMVKERLWALLNSNPSTPVLHGEGGIPDHAWTAFDAYQRRSAQALEEASERMGGADLLYVHDFQQVGVAAAWQGARIPRVFHLHTPYPSVMPEAWSEYLLGKLEQYDSVIVSTRRYADNLRAAGLRTPIHVIRPFIDPADFRPPTREDVATFRARFGITEGDRVVLNVGRMDPMKGQDRLIVAMPRVLREVPQARLVLVGNGSFSSSKRGGLGLSKGEQWRKHLESLAAELGVTERVTFTGHLGEDLLPAAYETCHVFSLPSTREGFGLAAIEAWRQERPVVVSDRAGVEELVQGGVHGYAVDCADPEQLADALVDLLRSDAKRARMGAAGRDASVQATLDVGAATLADLFASLLAKSGEVRPVAHA